MAKYSIQDTTLTAIGDAIRNKSGKHTRPETETYIATIPEVIVSKTPNATGFETHEGKYPKGDLFDVVYFPGASSIYVDLATDTLYNTGVDYLKIAPGKYNIDNFPLDTTEKIYNTDFTSGKPLRTQLTFDNTDVITILFHAYIEHNRLGYYAECKAFDADGNPMGEYQVELEREIEVPNTFTPAQMATEIEELSTYDPPAEAFEWSGDLSYKLRGGTWDWFVNDFGDRITTKDVSNLSYFANSAQSIVRIPFDINITPKITQLSHCFDSCRSAIEIPQLVGQINNGVKADIDYLFSSCNMLKEIPDDYFYTFGGIDYWTSCQQSTSGKRASMFSYCYSLKKLPDISMLKTKVAYYSCLYYVMCQNCHSLGSVENLPILEIDLTSNVLNNMAINCYRLKSFTFETNEDGTPKTARWKNQTFELSSNSGYTISSINRDIYINKYGNPVEKEIVDDATYQALKDDPDSWTANINYSRYNKLSAIETINSLPDTSAYLAEKGGTNIIKFKGASGALTDGGAINTLTAEEIAVAAAKGWTVTLV